MIEKNKSKKKTQQDNKTKKQSPGDISNLVVTKTKVPGIRGLEITQEIAKAMLPPKGMIEAQKAFAEKMNEISKSITSLQKLSTIDTKSPIVNITKKMEEARKAQREYEEYTQVYPVQLLEELTIQTEELIIQNKSLNKQTSELIEHNKGLGVETRELVNQNKELNTQTGVLIEQNRTLGNRTNELVNQNKTLGKLTIVLTVATILLVIVALVQIYLIINPP